MNGKFDSSKFLCLTFLYFTCNSVQAAGTEYFLLASWGYGNLHIDANSDVPVTAAISNRYSFTHNSGTTNFAGVGIGAGYHFNARHMVAASVSGYYLALPAFTGIVHPLYNIADDFDTLDFRLKPKSRALLGELRYFIENNFLTPYLYLAAGVARNSISSYHEFSTEECSSAVPMISPYENGAINRFAWGAGAGLKKMFNDVAGISLEYRFLNLDRAETGVGQNGVSFLPMQDLYINSAVLSFYLAWKA